LLLLRVEPRKEIHLQHSTVCLSPCQLNKPAPHI
jgi:hypothetical protein